MADVTFFLIVPQTRPASEFHSTRSPTLSSCVTVMMCCERFVLYRFVGGLCLRHRCFCRQESPVRKSIKPDEPKSLTSCPNSCSSWVDRKSTRLNSSHLGI